MLTVTAPEAETGTPRRIPSPQADRADPAGPRYPGGPPGADTRPTVAPGRISRPGRRNMAITGPSLGISQEPPAAFDHIAERDVDRAVAQVNVADLLQVGRVGLEPTTGGL
jgi:hypothetical protein